MAATTPDRYQMQGTAEADSLQLGSLLAFDWVPAPGELSGEAWTEAGHAVWNFPAAAVGRVVFEGVTAAAPFDARVGALSFAFTYAYGPDFALDSMAAGVPWHWDPVTGVLDPRQFGTVTIEDPWDPWGAARYDYRFGATGVSVDGIVTDYIVGSRENGTWQPAVGPVAAEVKAGAGDDTVLGAGGNDVLRGEAGADWLEGGDGHDRLLGGDGADHLDGGRGGDTIDGQRGDDLILAGDGPDVASGGSGNDTLRGGEGADILFGHQGDDLLDGGAGADWLIGGADTMQGWGLDTATYARSLAPVAIDLAAGTARGGEAEGDRLLFIRALQASGFGDALAGDVAANRLQGEGGDDTLGGAAGDDTLTGGRGDDLLTGGDGTDVAIFAGRRADYQVTLMADGQQALVRDLNTADGDEGTDRLTGTELLRFADATVAVALPPAHDGPRLIFLADDGTVGREAWVTDGTAAGTRLLADITPGSAATAFGTLVPLGDGRLLFAADDHTHGQEWWVTDGSTAETRMVADLLPGPGSGASWTAAPLGAGWAVIAVDEDGQQTPQPWVTDGTAAGTQPLLTSVSASNAQGSWPAGEGRAILSIRDAAHGVEPWITDGTTAGTHLLLDAIPGPAGSDPLGVTPLGDGRRFLFSAVPADPNGQRDLWVTDGTAAGTHRLKDFGGTSFSGDPWVITPLDHGRALFSAGDATHGAELWTTDGTIAGTHMVVDALAGSAAGFPTNIASIGGGRAVFANYGDLSGSAVHDRELWATDGSATGTHVVKDIRPGERASSPEYLTPLGDGRVVFTATDADADRELWVTDGTMAGTHRVKDIWPGTLMTGDEFGWGSSNPGGMTATGDGRVLFTANDGVHGAEPWVSDGTLAGTQMLADLAGLPGVGSGAWSFVLL